MSIHPPATGAEAANRLAIRELFDAYAHCADRRDAKGQMALFTEDTHFVVYMDARNAEPTQDLHGREALAPVFDALNAYVATMHFNGQSTVELNGDRATGESYCLAHHLTEAEDGSRTLMPPDGQLDRHAALGALTRSPVIGPDRRRPSIRSPSFDRSDPLLPPPSVIDMPKTLVQAKEII